MKLACQQYGQAWTTGDREQLLRTLTPRFAAVFQRMSAEQFRLLPRPVQPIAARVVASSRDYHQGSVTVQTAEGKLTFRLRLENNEWRVDDIEKERWGKEPLSVKDSLDIGLTVQEFLQELRQARDHTFYDTLSEELQQAFNRLTLAEIAAVRQFVPEPRPEVNPQITIHYQRATLRLNLDRSWGGKRFVVFHLVHQQRWRVADMQVEKDTVRIPSFRENLAGLAHIALLGAFLQNPRAHDLDTFTTPGPLQMELANWQDANLTRPASDSPLRFVIAADSRSAYAFYGNRALGFALTPSRQLIEEVIVVQEKSPPIALAVLLAQQRALQPMQNKPLETLQQGIESLLGGRGNGSPKRENSSRSPGPPVQAWQVSSRP